MDQSHECYTDDVTRGQPGRQPHRKCQGQFMYKKTPPTTTKKAGMLTSSNKQLSSV